MKSKHMKKPKDTKNAKRKQKLKIVDKQKFKRSVTICILFFLLIGVLIFKLVSGSSNVPATNDIFNTTISSSAQIYNNENNTPKIETTNRGEVSRTEKKEPTVLEQPETLYVNVKEGVNVRESYSSDSDKVKALEYGAEIKITAKMDNWGKIGEKQWVLLDNLSANKPKIEEEQKKETNTTTTKSSTKTTTTKNKQVNKKSTNNTASNGEYIKFTATAYCGCSRCCDKSTGKTASGTKATAGRTVAMSSKYAFGTKIEIKGYGTYVVEDRGGAISGNRIDIYFNSHSEALNFGRRTVYLRVVK